MGCAMVTGRILNWCHNCSGEKVKVPQGLKSLCRNYECRPYGTAVAPLLFPGTAVPGFAVLPLRGWSSVLFQRFRQIRDVTQSLRLAFLLTVSGTAGRGCGRGRLAGGSRPSAGNEATEKLVPEQPSPQRLKPHSKQCGYRSAEALRRPKANAILFVVLTGCAFAQTHTTVRHYRERIDDTPPEIAQAEDAIQKNDFGDAEALLKKAIDKDSNNYQ